MQRVLGPPMYVCECLHVFVVWGGLHICGGARQTRILDNQRILPPMMLPVIFLDVRGTRPPPPHFQPSAMSQSSCWGPDGGSSSKQQMEHGLGNYDQMEHDAQTPTNI